MRCRRTIRAWLGSDSQYFRTENLADMTEVNTENVVESRTEEEGDQGLRPLRIGIMLRGIREIDGPGVYIRGLCDELIETYDEDEFVLFYMNEEQAGRYADQPHTEEVVLNTPGNSKLLWDQLMVPIALWRESIDVLFHHKFSVPLVAPSPTVIQQRGVEYWTFPQWYDTVERLYSVLSIPVYCRVADAVLTVSDSLAEELSPHIGLPAETFETVYSAPAQHFRPISDRSLLANVRSKYDLPDRDFFLMVAKGYSRVNSSADEVYPRKNVGGTMDAYRDLQGRVDDPPPLVVAGPGFDDESVGHFKTTLPDPERAYFPGYVDHADMPALYSMARALVFPSYSEAFANPLLEAMACGCPIITSDISPCEEAIGEAGLTVNPKRSDEISQAMERLAEDQGLVEELQDRSLNRAKEFTWERSARKLRRILGRVAEK